MFTKYGVSYFIFKYLFIIIVFGFIILVYVYAYEISISKQKYIARIDFYIFHMLQIENGKKSIWNLYD